VQDQSVLNRNINKLYLIQICRWAMFAMPIFVLFQQDNGLTLNQILLLQAIFSIAIILFEIPSGYFSDTVGRKKTLVIGLFLSCIGGFGYIFASGFWQFLAVEIILGLGASFVSGTDSALLYDTLKEQNQESTYVKKEGILQSAGNFSEGIAGIFGGILALSSLRAPFAAQFVMYFIALIIGLTIYEPKNLTKRKASNPIKDIISIVKYSIHDHKESKALILYAGIVGASTLSMVFFIQPYFTMVGLPLVFFGFAWAILNFSVGIFSLYAYKFEQFIGRKKSLISLLLLSVTGYILLATFESLWAIPFILLFYAVRGISGPIINDYVNKLIESDVRATVLSVKNLMVRVIFSIVSPFIGYFADVYSLQTAFMMSAAFFLVTGTISLLFLHKHKAL